MQSKPEQTFIKNLPKVGVVNTPYAVGDKILKTARTGSKYMDVSLKDKTGEITGRMFSNDNDVVSLFDEILPGQIYNIRGEMNEYPRGSGKMSIVVKSLHLLSSDMYDLNDFTKTSCKDQELLIKEVESTIDQIEIKEYKDLLNHFFKDPEFTTIFYECPSAKVHHHNYIGGLLEHTLEVLEICKVTAQQFPELNKDLLFTAALLHDIGKIKTYDYDPLKIEISQQGRLLDHLYMSSKMVESACIECSVPELLMIPLVHLILSHHGEVRNGWGSPVNPQTPEAVALHHADNLNAKVKGMIQGV